MEHASKIYEWFNIIKISVEPLQYSEGKTLALLNSLRAIFASKAEAPWGAALVADFISGECTAWKLSWIALEYIFISNLV